MKKMIFLVLMVFISSCSLLHIHKIDVEQGNVLSHHEINRLQLGMTENDVIALLGKPALVNVFTPNQISYVYTLQEGQGNIAIKRVTCIFNNGYLQEIKQ